MASKWPELGAPLHSVFHPVPPDLSPGQHTDYVTQVLVTDLRAAHVEIARLDLQNSAMEKRLQALQDCTACTEARDPELLLFLTLTLSLHC